MCVEGEGGCVVCGGGVCMVCTDLYCPGLVALRGVEGGCAWCVEGGVCGGGVCGGRGCVCVY